MVRVFNYKTQEEASEVWCPSVRFASTKNEDGPRWNNRMENHHTVNCIHKKCAHWVENPTEVVNGKHTGRCGSISLGEEE